MISWIVFLVHLSLCCPSSHSLHLRQQQQQQQQPSNNNNGSLPSSSQIKSHHHHLKKETLIIGNVKIPPRGGSSPIEPNTNYVNYNQYMPPMLGNEQEQGQIRRPNQQNQYYGNNNNNNNNNYNQQQQQYTNNNQKLKPLTQVIQEVMSKLFISSPTIYYGILSCMAIFITWQIPIPIITTILRQHFVCSGTNIIHHHRYHTLLTSAISHNSISHLLMNLYGFYIFGKNVEPILQMNNLSLSTYCILSAILSNICFLLLTPKGSCIGLSGVTLSLLALDAKLHPSKEIGFVVRFIPIRLPAQYALTGLFVWSLLGVANSTSGRYDGVAHSVHFGGLVFGVIMYELLKRGIYKKYLTLSQKVWYDFKKVYGLHSRGRKHQTLNRTKRY